MEIAGIRDAGSMWVMWPSYHSFMKRFKTDESYTHHIYEPGRSAESWDYDKDSLGM